MTLRVESFTLIVPVFALGRIRRRKYEIPAVELWTEEAGRNGELALRAQLWKWARLEADRIGIDPVEMHHLALPQVQFVDA